MRPGAAHAHRALRFPGAFGDSLAARLEVPADREPLGYALFAHCFSCSKDLKAIRRISSAVAGRGIVVLRFDFTGLGESEGDFADTHFSSNLDDLEAAAAFLRSEYEAPSLLVGHSLGGTAVLAVAGRLPEVRAVATLAAPATTDQMRGVILRSAPELATANEAVAKIAGRSFRLRRSLVEDLGRANVEAALGALRVPLLVLHSPDDEILGIEHAERIYAAAQQPKSLVALRSADHLLLRDPPTPSTSGG